MAFKRDWLKTMGLTDEQISAIMEEHTAVTDALKAQRDKAQNEAKTLQEKADKVDTLEKEITDLKGGEDYKTKYEQEHQAYKNYKEQIAREAETAKVKAAYRQLLLDERISERRVDSVLKLTDFSEMKLGDDGKLENLEALKENIGKEWGDFQVTQKERKPSVPTPPSNGNPGGEGRAREIYLNRLKQQGINIDAGKE